jgi:hypothetical protein
MRQLGPGRTVRSDQRLRRLPLEARLERKCERIDLTSPLKVEEDVNAVQLQIWDSPDPQFGSLLCCNHVGRCLCHLPASTSTSVHILLMKAA